MLRRITILLIFLTCYQSSIFACSIFHVTSDKGQVFVGRNFDWTEDGGNVWFIPRGEKTYGIIIFEQEGKDMPYEGVNEKGLFVGIAAVPDTDTPFSLFKSMTTSLGMVKRALERASNVNEAIKLFQEHTLIFGTLLGNPVVHFKLVDRENNSAIIEYVNGEMVVIKDPIECQIMTNHFISLENSAQLSKTSFKRYESLRDELRKNFYSHIDVAQSLARVANDYETIGFYTVWSNVYDLTNLLIWTKYKNQEYKKTDIASVLRNANKESHLPIAEIK